MFKYSRHRLYISINFIPTFIVKQGSGIVRNCISEFGRINGNVFTPIIIILIIVINMMCVVYIFQTRRLIHQLSVFNEARLKRGDAIMRNLELTARGRDNKEALQANPSSSFNSDQLWRL